MRKTSLALSSLCLAAATVPALAGNYAEGDPRPSALPTQLTTAQVQHETRQWRATAPTVGYPEGHPRATAIPGQKSRAEVHAEAVAWTRSGMSEIAYGEVALDSRGPSYERALQAFRALSADRQAVAAPLPAPLPPQR